VSTQKKEARLIGITGTNGAGKGEVAAFLEERSYAYFSLSDLIREELRKRGEKITRNNLIRMGNQLRKRHGSDILAKRVMEKVKDKAVIDSIRNPREIDHLRRQQGFVLLAVDAPVEMRYDRIRARGRDESATTLTEFIEREQEEMSRYEKGQQLKACMELADYRIYNDGTIEDLHKTLEEWLWDRKE
jgi:dephospho-CoA kinase